VGSAAGVGDEKLEQLHLYRTSPLFSERERIVLGYAEAVTLTGAPITDETFATLRSFFSDDEIVELTTIIAWENSSSKFNHAMNVPSMSLWRR
jgi:alkylhydroperoxidase family enzyme